MGSTEQIVICSCSAPASAYAAKFFWTFTQDEIDMKREISIQAKFEGYFPSGEMTASAPWGSKLKHSQVPAPHSPVCFEEKPASRQSICTTLSCYHSQIPLSGLQRCRIVSPVPSYCSCKPSLFSVLQNHQVLEGHSNGSRSPAQAHPSVIIFMLLLLSHHSKVINPIRNDAGRTQLLTTGHSA